MEKHIFEDIDPALYQRFEPVMHDIFLIKQKDGC